MDIAVSILCKRYGLGRGGAEPIIGEAPKIAPGLSMDEELNAIFTGTNYCYEIQESMPEELRALLAGTKLHDAADKKFLVVHDRSALDSRLSLKHPGGDILQALFSLSEILPLRITGKLKGPVIVEAFEMELCTVRELLDKMCFAGGLRWKEQNGVIHVARLSLWDRAKKCLC